MKYNYPFQVASLKQDKNGEKKTLGIDAQLSVASDEKTMPLEIHSGYSRFVATIIKKSEKDTAFNIANIPANDVFFIYEKTKMAMNAKIGSLSNVQTPASPAYTVRFALGTFKGKSPAEVLIENPANREALIKQGEFLNKNLEKYPANKKMVDAIKEALILMKNGELKATEQTASPIIEIYNEQTKPLRSKKKDDKCLVYGIKVTADISRNLPFCIEITNCYAPVATTEDGRLNVHMKDAIEMRSISMNMSEKDWFKVINRMYLTVENFESKVFKKQFIAAKDAFQSNLNESKK